MMKAKNALILLIIIAGVAIMSFRCNDQHEIASFTYKGVVVEGYDPAIHTPSPEFASNVEQKKVLLNRAEVKMLKKCIRLFIDHDLSHLLKLTNKFVIVKCPYSFADKPQSTIYLDREKIKPHITLGNDWDYKLMQFGLHQGYHIKGNPEFSNLFRIMLHELGHLVEYKKLQFSWKGQFVANELNRDFVQISWDERQNWKDRESILERVHNVTTEEELLDFFRWFKEESSFFSIYSGTGMNEDFAEAFLYYYLRKHFDFTLDLVYKDQVVIADLQKINYSREKKLRFIEAVMEE